MRTKKGRTFTTSLGTQLHVQGNPVYKKFIVKETKELDLDSRRKELVGTKKTFLKDSIIEGIAAIEVKTKNGASRPVIVIQDDNGAYIMPFQNLESTTDSEIKKSEKIKELEQKLERVIEKGEEVIEETLDATTEKAESFLDKKYGDFTGKEIILGVLGIVIIYKFLK
jgi:hypothetical protein